MAKVPSVNTTACIGCAACVASCPNQVLDIKDGKCAIVHPEKCKQCGECQSVCPVEAIKLP